MPPSEQKLKPVLVEECGETVRRLMTYQIEKFHQHLYPDRILLLWRRGWRADKDTGRIKFSQSVKANDVVRAVVNDYELIILLNCDIWERPDCVDEHKAFIMDTALRAFKPALDKSGEQIEDAEGGLYWRIEDPSIQTWPEIIERHGFVNAKLMELCQLAQSLDHHATPLFDRLEASEEDDVDEELTEAPRKLVGEDVADVPEESTVPYPGLAGEGVIPPITAADIKASNEAEHATPKRA